MKKVSAAQRESFLHFVLREDAPYVAIKLEMENRLSLFRFFGGGNEFFSAIFVGTRTWRRVVQKKVPVNSVRYRKSVGRIAV